MLDYYLPSNAQEVSLEILDGSGAAVQTYESGGSGQRAQQGQGMRQPFTQTTGTGSLQTTRGAHRFVWNLSVAAEGSNRGGPRVVPGNFHARLTVDGQELNQWFEVKIDPRVAEDGVTIADLQEQFDLSLEILAAMGDANSTIERVQEAMEQAAAGGDVSAQLDEIHAALVTDQTISSYPQPMLQAQLQYLYSGLQRADQKPGRDSFERLETLEAELAAHKARLERLLRTITEDGAGM